MRSRVLGMRTAATLWALGLAAAHGKDLSIGFLTPEVHLAEFTSQSLSFGDLNADGLTDILLINNEKGRIDLYVQESADAATPRPTPVLSPERWQPVLSDARFQRQSLVLGGTSYALVTGDFNGDGIGDFAVSGDQNKLLVFHGPLVAGWAPFQRVDVTAIQNIPGTMAWDPAEKAIVLLGETEIQEVRWNEALGTYAARTVGTPPSEQKPYGLLLEDIDGDGRLDVMYSLRNARFNLAFHLRKENGLGFVQLPLLDPPGQQFEPLERSPLELLSLNPRSGAIQRHAFVPNPDAREIGKQETLAVDFLHLPAQASREYHFAWGDLNGDGFQDLLALLPNQPELAFFRGEKDGGLSLRETHPIPAGCEWMALGEWLPADGVPQILLHDADTSFLGHSAHAEGRLGYPALISNRLELVGAAPWRPEGGDRDLMVTIAREKRQYSLRVFRLEKADAGLAAREIQNIPLPFLERDPYPLMPMRFAADGPSGFLACSAFDSAFFVLPTPEGELRVQEAAPGFSQALLKKKRPNDFASLPDHPAFPSPWVMFGDGVAQFLAADAQGVVRILDQMNLQGSNGQLAGLLPLADGHIGLLDSRRNLIELHLRGANGRLGHLRDLALPPVQALGTRLVAKSNGEFELYAMGRNQIAHVFPRGPDPKVDTTVLYETDLPETRHVGILAGDFNGDGVADIAAIDPAKSNVMEFITRRDGRWTSVMHFRIYDTAQNFRGRRGGGMEPREAHVKDLNGDGLDDVAILVHDRILIYLQDPGN